MNGKYEKEQQTLYNSIFQMSNEWPSNYINVSNWKVHISTMLEIFGSKPFSAAN